MLSEDPKTTPLSPDKLLDIYKEICTNIRVTDEISFKLLGMVPLASGIGSGALTILRPSEPLGVYAAGLAVAGLSALGALITLGLLRWELRNIQKCNWLIARAAHLETEILGKGNLQFGGIAKPEDLAAKEMSEVCVSSFFKIPWGKTQAEKLVYFAAIGFWLLPLLWIAMDRFFSLR